jgi:hypothetical protein
MLLFYPRKGERKKKGFRCLHWKRTGCSAQYICEHAPDASQHWRTSGVTRTPYFGLNDCLRSCGGVDAVNTHVISELYTDAEQFHTVGLVEDAHYWQNRARREEGSDARVYALKCRLHQCSFSLCQNCCCGVSVLNHGCVILCSVLIGSVS